MLKTLQRITIASASAALWPAYFLLIGVLARSGPWPKDIGRPLGFVLTVLALTVFATSMLRWIFRRGGWLEQSFALPSDVLRQIRRAKYALIACGTAFLLPEEILSRGLITTGGRPVTAPTIGHLLIIGFELMCWVGLTRLLRSGGPVGAWLETSPEQIGWAGRHRRSVRAFLLVALAGVILLEVRGFGFTARRLATAGLQSIALIWLCWALHRLSCAIINKHGWRWARREAKAAANASGEPNAPAADLPIRVRNLVDWGVPIVGGLIGLWVWDVDLALFNYIGVQRLWGAEPGGSVTVANATEALMILGLTAWAWRYLSTIFALVVYPRMPEDPGVRFATLTLCRYLVLGIGTLAGLSSIHLGLDKIGVVLAALGVGLGFGLQEIVSNFVSGIILLVERPIRVGDVVTVGTLSGKIDRINIRATTLINADNQSVIIPNREFITGNLVNWTHKDKVIRFSIPVHVALGTDPDEVSSLLLEIARGDSDVLGNPVPLAYLDAFGAASLGFILHVYVPDPSFPGKVRHRLCTQIQRRFAEAGIKLALPLQKLQVDAEMLESIFRATGSLMGRDDGPEEVPAPPHILREPVPYPRNGPATRRA